MVLSNAFYYERIQLDTVNERFNKVPTAKEGDANGRGMIVVLTENGLVKNTTGVSLLFKWEHTRIVGAQGLEDFEPLDLTKGEYIVTYPAEMNHEGYVKAEIRIIDNGKYAGSRNMKIQVEPSVGDDTAMESSNEFRALVSALVEVQSWNSRIDDVEQEFIDKANNLDATYPTRLVSVEQQLEQANELGTEFNKQLHPNVTKKPIITFVDDDISPDVWTRLQPIFESKGVPCVLAAPLKFVNEHNINNLLDVQNRLGWEIASHGNYHTKSLNSCTEAELETELKGSYDGLRQLGLDVENMVYPYGEANQHVRGEVAKIFKCGVTTNHLKSNDIPLKQYFMGRSSWGSYFDPLENGSLGNTYEYYKSRVDDAIANKQWLVVMLHIAATDDTELQYIANTIDYIISCGVEIVTLKKGLKTFGNVIVTGDFTGNFKNDKYSLITKTGLHLKNDYLVSEVNFSTPITNYPLGQSTKSYLDADNGGFPYGAGLVVTYREKEGIDFSYQLYYVYGTNTIYRRYVKSDYVTWSDFRLMTPSIPIPIGSYSANSVRDNFPNNDTTMLLFDQTNATGFPNNAGGLLITRRYGNLAHQTYYRINNANIYTRYWDLEGKSWTTWVSISVGLQRLTVDVNFGTINAQTSKTVTVSYTGATYGDFVVVSPYTALPNGISIYASQYDANLVTVTIVNSTSASIAVDTKKIILKVIRN